MPYAHLVIGGRRYVIKCLVCAIGQWHDVKYEVTFFLRSMPILYSPRGMNCLFNTRKTCLNCNICLFHNPILEVYETGMGENVLQLIPHRRHSQTYCREFSCRLES